MRGVQIMIYFGIGLAVGILLTWVKLNWENWRDDWLQSRDEIWKDSERNTINQIVCRVHPDGADAIQAFWDWWREQKPGAWFGPHRACGVWLRKEIGDLGL